MFAMNKLKNTIAIPETRFPNSKKIYFLDKNKSEKESELTSIFI